VSFTRLGGEHAGVSGCAVDVGFILGDVSDPLSVLLVIAGVAGRSSAG
jgi:hypothetical protein